MQSKLSQLQTLQQLLRSFRNYSVGGAALVFSYAILHHGFSSASISDTVLIWGDAFTISGVFLFLIVGALALYQKGYLDWVAYGLYLSRFLLLHRRNAEYVNFYDYKKMRNQPHTMYWPGLLTATFFFLLGLGLSMLFFFI